MKVDSTQTVENGVLVEGVVSVKVLYIVSDDSMPFYSMEAMVPFSHVIEAVGIDEHCIYHLHTDLEQLSTTMVDSNEIEVKIVLNLNALILNRQQEYARDYCLYGAAGGYTVGYCQIFLHYSGRYLPAQ